MSLKQYNWTDGEVITAEKLNRGGVTVVGATVETNENSMRVTLDMTLQEIYDAMGKGIVVWVHDSQEGARGLSICGTCILAEEKTQGFAIFYIIADGTYVRFSCATNDSFPYVEQE